MPGQRRRRWPGIDPAPGLRPSPAEHALMVSEHTCVRTVWIITIFCRLQILHEVCLGMCFWGVKFICPPSPRVWGSLALSLKVLCLKKSSFFAVVFRMSYPSTCLPCVCDRPTNWFFWRFVYCSTFSRMLQQTSSIKLRGFGDIILIKMVRIDPG